MARAVRRTAESEVTGPPARPSASTASNHPVPKIRPGSPFRKQKGPLPGALRVHRVCRLSYRAWASSPLSTLKLAFFHSAMPPSKSVTFLNPASVSFFAAVGEAWQSLLAQ